MSDIVAIEDLKPGMVILQITKQNGPVKIRKSGLVTSEAMVQGLSKMGVQELEIDLEQTVEIVPVVQHRTSTQALLRGQHNTSAKADKSLNEHFNRRLFLPTTEGLPLAWKLHSKKAVYLAAAVMGGLVLGFFAAMQDHLWPLNRNSAEFTLADKLNAEVTSDGKSNIVPDHVSSLEHQDGKNPDTQKSEAQVTSKQTSVAQSYTSIASQRAVKTVSSNDTEQQDVYASFSTQQGASETIDANAQSMSSESDEYEGIVLNEPSNQDNISVSPELLARFNQAVEALDVKPESSRDESETRVTVRDDIRRIDQLPVRLLTRLPSMDFSAHMYASLPANRWVRVNGRQMGEGSWIADKVQIVNIEAQRVVLSFEDELFTMAALTDW